MKRQTKLTEEQRSELTLFIGDKSRNGAEIRRAQAVLYVNENTPGEVIQKFTQLSHTQAFAIRRSYLLKGIAALSDKRHNNRDRVLTHQERDKVISEVKSKSPKDLIGGCSDEYWNTYWLGQYIYTLTGKKYKSKTSSYLLFKEAKLTWHKPGKVYDKADPARREQWKQETRVLLQPHWDNPYTLIICVDEMVLSIKSTTQKIWLPQGEYPPVVETTGTRKNVSFYGFLNMKTGEQHTFITEYQNMYITRDQLIKLRQIYPDKHLVVLWDNAGWHRGSEVIKWITEDKNTEVVYFPPYSPDLNPQERVWKAGRTAITHNKQITDIQGTVETFKTHLESHTFPYELLGFKSEVTLKILC